MTFAVVNKGKQRPRARHVAFEVVTRKLPLASTRDVYEVGRIGKTSRIHAGPENGPDVDGETANDCDSITIVP